MSHITLYDVINGIEYPIEDRITQIGRGEECSIRLLSSSVSRHHGQLTLDQGVLKYQDLGSSNGSYINAELIDSTVKLSHGDSLFIGDFQFNVRTVDANAFENAVASDDLDEEQTRLQAENRPEIPAMWFENAGLEQASGTEFLAADTISDRIKSYRTAKFSIAEIGSSPRLVMLESDSSAQVIELDSAKARTINETTRVWKIGRNSEEVEIPIMEASVSGVHAQIVNEEQRWKVVNWMSTNGTFVNGHRALSAFLSTGDIIRIGNVLLAFELPSTDLKNTRSSKSNDRAPSKQQSLFARFLSIFKRN